MNLGKVARLEKVARLGAIAKLVRVKCKDL